MNYPFGRNMLLSSVGFERFINALSDFENTASENKTPSYPPYNIVKEGEHDYTIELAVAGFKREELDITFEGNKLTITGKVDGQRPGDYLHRGIATRDFEHHFTLAETVVIKSADLQDGLLIVRLRNVIPEEKKPRKIAIGQAQDALLFENKQAA